jgi:hypothetical protein
MIKATAQIDDLADGPVRGAIRKARSGEKSGREFLTQTHREISRSGPGTAPT